MSVVSKLYCYAHHTVLHFTYAVLRILRLDGLMRLGRSTVTTSKKSQLEDANAHQTAGEATQHTQTTGVVTHDVFDRKGAIDSSLSAPDLPVSSLSSQQKEEEASQDIVRGSEATPIERELESRHTEEDERVAQPVTTTLPVSVDKLGDLVLLHEMSPVKMTQLTGATHAHQSMSLPDMLKSMEPPKVHSMELISQTMEALNLATMPMKSLSDVSDLIKKPTGASGGDKKDLGAMRAIDRASVESNATEETDDELTEDSAGQPVELTTSTTTDESTGVPIAERPEDQNDPRSVEGENSRVSDCDDNGQEELSTVQALVANAEAAVAAAESAQHKKAEAEQKSGSEEVPSLNTTEEKEVIETARALIQEAKACVDATKEAQEELLEMEKSEIQQGVVPAPKSQPVSLSDPFEEFSSSDEDLTEVNDTFVSVPPFLPAMMMTIVHSSIQ